jgi:hypothetical protein
MSADRPEGLEGRLRDSLRAYAELVDAPDRDADRPRGPRHAVEHRGRRTAALLAAAAAVVVTGSVWLVDADRSDTVASSAAGSAESAAEASSRAAAADTWAAAAPADPGEALTPPASPEVGVAYPVDLLTHCGVVGTEIGGTWFAADPPLVAGPGSPPAGWDDPYQRGVLTLLSDDEAVFRDGAGHEVRLRAGVAADRPAPCD